MLLFILLTLLLSSRDGGSATPLPLLQARALGVRAANEPATRTMVDIILGCASTTFICTWVSVHPNVPPGTTEEYGWKSLLRRLRLMFWALVAPELVLAWSAKQWYVAGQIADFYNAERGIKTSGIRKTIWSFVKNNLKGKESEDAETSKAWTRTHGHLVAMGGIILSHLPDTVNNQTAKEEPTILTPEILKDLLKNPEFEINIDAKDIEDKAKGDFLSKSILIFQTTWFMMQCAARFVEGIGVTELEVVTLALASLNAIMSFFWWNKPLGLTVPMKVPMKRKLERRIENDEQGLDKLLSVFTEHYALRVFEIFWHNQGERPFIRWFFFLPGCILILFFLLVLLPIIFIAGSLYGVMASNTIPGGATHVRTFYSPKTASEVMIFRMIFPIFGAVFGGLHCLGWTFTFPTEAEQKIWKFGSITITIIPILYFLTALSSVTTNDGLSTTLKPRRGPIKTLFQAVAGLVAIISVAISWVYLFARLTLLIEAVVLLREQPPSVFFEVDWTLFVPHIKF